MDIQTKDGILLRGIPDGTPDDVIKARIQEIRAGQSSGVAPAQDKYAGGVAADKGQIESLKGAIGDTIYGGAKGFADLVQGGVAQPILNGAAAVLQDERFFGKPGPASQWVIDKAGQYDDFLKQQESQYQQDTDGSFAAGAGRVGAGVLPFMLSGGGSAAPQAAAKLGPLVQALKTTAANSGKGAAYATTQPVVSGEDYLSEKGTQAAIGGLASALMTPVASVAGRIISPKTRSEVKQLIDEGITPTPGQILGGAWSKAEDKMTSLPLIGDLVKNSQRRSIDDFNRAAYSRALLPIGEKPTANIGRAGVEEVKTKLGAAYDDLLPKLNFKADKQFSDELTNLTSMAKNGNVPPEVSRQFESIVKNEVMSRMTKQGSMDGKSFKELESKLSQEIKRFKGSPDPNDKTLGDALSEVLSSARGVLSRSNPQYSEQLSKINQGYANYARIRSAASSLGAEDGVFTPAQLQNAVKAQDKSAGKGNFATGNALMQDLSETGKNVLGAKYPDSGTAGRSLFALAPAAATAAYLNPALAALGGGAGTLAAAPYTTMGQKLMAALLAKRPAAAKPIAEAVESGAPMLAPAITPALIEALKARSN